MRKFLSLFAFLTIAGQASALQIQTVTPPSSIDGYIKVFVKPMVSETDILFVVDSSGSMSPHQQNMARNIPVLTQELANKGSIGLNAAVLTADMEGGFSRNPDKGTFRRILNSASPTFSADLAQAMVVGTSGSGTEKHFAAMKAALTSPLLETVNAGFLRPSAHLTVIFLTDAEDQSDAALTAEAMATFLTDLKGSAGVSVYSFMSPQTDASCSKDAFDQLPKIELMVNNMGGQVFNLCDADWHAPMISIADKMVNEVTRTIRLPTEPVRRTLEVRFGTKVLTPGDLRRGWVYDESNNSILIGDLVEWTGQAPGTELEIKFVPEYWE